MVNFYYKELVFNKWSKVFQNTTITGAIVERLVYKDMVLDITRETRNRYTRTIHWQMVRKRKDKE